MQVGAGALKAWDDKRVPHMAEALLLSSMAISCPQAQLLQQLQTKEQQKQRQKLRATGSVRVCLI
jgi:hypothetical protein